MKRTRKRLTIRSAIALGVIGLSKRQRALAKKHGTPAEFAKAIYGAVPGMISMDEARAAVDEYGRKWGAAA